MRLQQTYEVHSGYCFRGSLLYKIGLTNSDGAAYHDFHHTKKVAILVAECILITSSAPWTLTLKLEWPKA